MRESEMVFGQRNVKVSLLQDILSYIRENDTRLHNPELRARVITENLMLREYFRDPDVSYSECRKRIQPQIPEQPLTDLFVKERAKIINLTERKDRRALIEWATAVVEKIYIGMSGSHTLLEEADNQLRKPYAKGLSKPHPIQHRLILTGMFELIPDLRSSEEREMLLQFGKPYSVRCLNKIITSALYDTSSKEERLSVKKNETAEELMRELYLARKELADYKELTEAADAEFEDRLTALRDGEIIRFFAQLSDPKYGYLIDSLFTQSQALRELRKNRTELPYQIEGVPIVIRNMIQFLREAGISPASEYPPNSVQHLLLENLSGVTFLPDPTREEALLGSTDICVRVISSGWKYKDLVISQPVFQEMGEKTGR